MRVREADPALTLSVFTVPSLTMFTRSEMDAILGFVPARAHAPRSTGGAEAGGWGAEKNHAFNTLGRSARAHTQCDRCSAR